MSAGPQKRVDNHGRFADDRSEANQSALANWQRIATNAFNARFGVTFPVLIDDSKAGYAVSNAYGISLVPSLFVIEPDGKVSKSFTGFSKSELESLGKRTGIAPFRPDDNVPEWKAG